MTYDSHSLRLCELFGIGGKLNDLYRDTIILYSCLFVFFAMSNVGYHLI